MQGRLEKDEGLGRERGWEGWEMRERERGEERNDMRDVWGWGDGGEKDMNNGVKINGKEMRKI